MKNIKTHAGFTLVELIVSMTILSMILVSVVSIFLFASQMSTRVELNRAIQENIKNVMEDIAEGVRQNSLEGISSSVEGNCVAITEVNPIIHGSAVCVGNSLYTLGKKNNLGNWSRSSITDCQGVEAVCQILRKQGTGNYIPMTNSFMSVENLEFIITNTEIPKLTIIMKVRPAIKKGMSSELILNNTLTVQTTVSQRLIDTN